MNEPFDPKPLITAIRDWATTLPSGYRLSGSQAGLAYLQLLTQPDPQGPEVQLTFRPVMVDGHPLIRVEHPALETESAPDRAPDRDSELAVRVLREVASSAAREPDARCEACGVIGTVGHASRTDSGGAVLESHRFCGACWPEQMARYRARWSEEARLHSDRFLRGQEPARGAGPAMAFEAATWHITLELVRGIQRQLIAPVPPSKEALADLAREIETTAPLFDGEMPYEVEAFIRRFG